MKKRFFYFFAVGVCALLLLLLLTVHKGQPQLASHNSPQRVISNAMTAKDNSKKVKQLKFLKERKPDAQSVTAFQFITDKLNKMGITANDVEVDLDNGIVKWSPNSKWVEYYGKPSSESQPIAPIILKLRQTLKANSQGIRGCYKTKWGLLRLYVKDDVVVGTFDYYGRKHIIGKLKDNILVGVWISPAKNKRPMLVGPIQFAFSKNWSAFRSVWRYQKQPQFTNKWVGTKIKCPDKGTKLPQIKDLGGPGVPSKPKPGQGKPGSPTGAKMPQKNLPPAKK